MTKYEKAYIIAKEKALWENLFKAQKVFGIEDPYVNTLRTEWSTVYEICQHMFPEYRVKATLAE